MGTDLRDFVQRARPRFKTATSFVAETLREAILSGTIHDGSSLRQDELADAFGLSRMPIREALRQLEAEGLVDFEPHKGAVVATLSPDDVSEIFEMRLLAEVFVLRLSFPCLSSTAMDRATDLLDEMDKEQDPLRLCALHRRFHGTLYSGAERKRLNALIGSLNDSVDRYLRFLLINLGHEKRSQEEHRAILDACRVGDVDHAVNLLEEHLREGGRMLVDYLRHRSQAKTES